MDLTSMSDIMYTEEQYGKSRKVPRDTKLMEAFQFKINKKCIVLTISFILSVLWQIKFSKDIDDYPATPLNFWTNMFNKMVILVVYALLLGECFKSKTRHDLCEMKLMDFPDATKYMRRLRKAEPIVWWKVICYHYKNGDKIISKVVDVRFYNGILRYRDISDIVVFSQNSPLVKISLSKEFMFGTTERVTEYHFARMGFFLDYEYDDKCAKKFEGVDLLSANTKFHDVVWAGKVPRFINLFTYWLFSCLLLSWPYRVYFNYKTAAVNVDIKKTFGARPKRRKMMLRNIVYRPLPLDHALSDISDLFLTDTEEDLEIYDSAPPSPNFRLPNSRCYREYNESGDYFTYWYRLNLGRYDMSPSYTNSLQTAIPCDNVKTKAQPLIFKHRGRYTI